MGNNLSKFLKTFENATEEQKEEILESRKANQPQESEVDKILNLDLSADADDEEITSKIEKEPKIEEQRIPIQKTKPIQDSPKISKLKLNLTQHEPVIETVQKPVSQNFNFDIVGTEEKQEESVKETKKISLQMKPKVEEYKPVIEEPPKEEIVIQDKENSNKLSAADQRAILEQIMSEERPSTRRKPIEKSVMPEVKSKDPSEDEELIDKLFIESETSLQFKDKWVKFYKQAWASGKKTMTSEKLRKGKFRLDPETGNLEILPDFSTYNKSSRELMNQQWFREGKET